MVWFRRHGSPELVQADLIRRRQVDRRAGGHREGTLRHAGPMENARRTDKCQRARRLGILGRYLALSTLLKIIAMHIDSKQLSFTCVPAWLPRWPDVYGCGKPGSELQTLCRRYPPVATTRTFGLKSPTSGQDLRSLPSTYHSTRKPDQARWVKGLVINWKFYIKHCGDRTYEALGTNATIDSQSRPQSS